MGILQKKRRTTGKKALAYRGKGGQKYRYCFSCLRVRGGSLLSNLRPEPPFTGSFWGIFRSLGHFWGLFCRLGPQKDPFWDLFSISSCKSGKEKTHKHKQICGIIPALGGCQKVVYVFFFRVIPYGGEKTHKQNSPPKPGTIPWKIGLRVFFFMCFFRSLVSPGVAKVRLDLRQFPLSRTLECLQRFTDVLGLA